MIKKQIKTPEPKNNNDQIKRKHECQICCYQKTKSEHNVLDVDLKSQNKQPQMIPMNPKRSVATKAKIGLQLCSKILQTNS